jgi:hypothetical protein
MPLVSWNQEQSFLNALVCMANASTHHLHALNSTEVCSIQVKGAATEHTKINRDSGRREGATMRKGLMPAAGARSGCLAEHETMYLPGA